MRIAYLDLNDTHVEDYSVAPKRYGGGAVFARWAKERFPFFHIFADKEAFRNVTDKEKINNCWQLSSEQRRLLREGAPVKGIIPYSHHFDLYVYHQANLHLNLDGLDAKQCCWAIGYGEQVHPRIENLLLYSREFQSPVLRNSNTRIFNVVIGKPIPEFKERKKSDYIFQCTRHTPTFGSIQVAEFCLREGITGTFAGPIDPGYDLLSYIDGKTTHYLGTISEETKLIFTAEARLYTMCHSWSTPFNLSAIESLAHGTPIAATPVGFWLSLINSRNGFIVSDYDDLRRAWEMAPSISQKDCWESVQGFSVDRMIESFEKAFFKV